MLFFKKNQRARPAFRKSRCRIAPAPSSGSVKLVNPRSRRKGNPVGCDVRSLRIYCLKKHRSD